METTDMHCIVNEIGRIVIPVKLRKRLNITEDSNVEFFVKDGSIHIQKLEPACTLCNTSGKLQHFKGKAICNTCLNDLIPKIT